MDKSFIYDENTCTISNSPTYINRRAEACLDIKTSWENESTMKILGLDNVENQIRFSFKKKYVEMQGKEDTGQAELEIKSTTPVKAWVSIMPTCLSE